MSSPIARATSQAVILNILSNTFAQGVTAYQKKSLDTFDLTSLLQFVFLAIIVTPPNYLWQRFLEDTFPASGSAPSRKVEQSEKADPASEKKQLSVKNTAIKFALDQTVGCVLNTIAFIFLMGMLKGKALPDITSSVQNDTWGMMKAGYKLWPAVCLLNFSVVPFEHRMTVGNIAAFGWGVYVNLFVPV